MAEGNRKDPRARVLNMTVRYKSATVDEFIENHSHDISKGGIFIKTRAPFPAGTLLKFEVRIAEDQRLMHGVGRVVWRREPDRAEESFPAGMGIKFIKTGEGAAELISQIVAARQGVESSFDAGIRESAVSDRVAAGVPPALPSEVAVDARLNGVDGGEAPSLRLEGGSRGLPNEAETQVSSPPKKRAHAPEKRKVVLQGPALDAPPSSKPAVAVARVTAEETAEHAPSHSVGQRATSFEETTSPRARASRGAQRSNSPSVYGLIAIVGAVALVGVFIKRNRDAAQEQLAVEPEQAQLVQAVPPPVTAPAEPTLAPPSIETAEPEPGENAEGALNDVAVPGAAAPVPAAPVAAVPGAPATPTPNVPVSSKAAPVARAPVAPAPVKATAPVPAPASGSSVGTAPPKAVGDSLAQSPTEKAPVTPPKAKTPVPDRPAAEATAPKPAAPKPAAAPKPVAPAPTAPVAAQPPPGTNDDNPY
jgi:uncharacterized protein (TIGR02266 family)